MLRRRPGSVGRRIRAPLSEEWAFWRSFGFFNTVVTGILTESWFLAQDFLWSLVYDSLPISAQPRTIQPPISAPRKSVIT